MMRTTTNKLTTKSAAFCRANHLLPKGSRILCALSGGADSMALLTLLRSLAPGLGLQVSAGHFNHNLRGEESRRDEEFVTDWCRRNDIPLTISSADVAKEAKDRGLGLEETARILRYEFLEKAAAGMDYVATAHNADDNAETVLLHLARGTGLDGLTGIPPKRGKIIRPLLSCTRQEIEDYLAAEGIPHVEDSSNLDPAYARNRIRQSVMPVLRSLNPAFSDTLAENLLHLRADRDYLYAASKERIPYGKDGLSVPDLLSAPKPLAVRAIKNALMEAGQYDVSYVHLEGVLRLCASEKPGAQLPLPGGLTAWREYDRLLIGRELPEAFSPVVLVEPCAVILSNGWSLEVLPELCPEKAEQSGRVCYVRNSGFPLMVRPRKTGDTLRLPGRNEKTLKKWCIDEKIPRHLRDALPVVERDGWVLACAALGPQSDEIAQPGESALCLRFIEP